MANGNWSYLTSLSGIFRLLTVITGIPAIVLAWIAYFSSSWTDVFPEILAILAVEKSVLFEGYNAVIDSESSIGNTTDSSLSTPPSTTDMGDTEYDIISDTEEEYLDAILMQTLMYEKFFIGIVSVVFVISASYLILRIVTKHLSDSPYEIMFDFIFHVLCALGLLTGSGLVLLSAAKIQDFVDKVHDRDGFAPQEIVNIINRYKDNVQDKVDKIAASVIGMLNGIFYTLCVVTIRMLQPLKCGCRKKKPHYCNRLEIIPRIKQHYHNDVPVYSLTPLEFHDEANSENCVSYGFFRDNYYTLRRTSEEGERSIRSGRT